MIAASRGNILGKRAPQRAHICHELPSLHLGNPATKRRHPIRAALHHGCHDVLRLSAVDPLVIHQGRADASAAVRVATDAVVPLKQSLAFTYGVGALFICIGRSGRRKLFRPWMEAAHVEPAGGYIEGRWLAEATVLSFTRTQYARSSQQDYKDRTCPIPHQFPFRAASMPIGSSGTP